MALTYDLTLSHPRPRPLRAPATSVAVRSEEDICDAVMQARLTGTTVRAVGARGSKNACYRTEGATLHLGRYDRVLAIDGRSITVEAGITCGQLNDILWRYGLFLPTQGEWQGATIAGALATGVHGGALGHGILPSSVRSLRLISGNGVPIDIQRGTDLFANVAVSLGLFGVTSTVRLDCVPACYLELVSEVIPIEAYLRNLATFAASNEFFSAVWIPSARQVITWAANPASAPDRIVPRRQRYSIATTVANLVSQRLTKGEVPRRWFQGRAVDAAHRIVTPIGEGSRVMRGVRLLTRHWREAEFAVPFARAGEAITRLEALVARYPDALTVPVGLRATARDGFSLSPCRDRDTFWLAVFYRDRNGFGDELSDLFQDLEARNHWGKHPNLPGDYLRRQYPAWEQVAAARRRLDPAGVFSNDFSRRFAP